MNRIPVTVALPEFVKGVCVEISAEIPSDCWIQPTKITDTIRKYRSKGILDMDPENSIIYVQNKKIPDSAAGIFLFACQLAKDRKFRCISNSGIRYRDQP